MINYEIDDDDDDDDDDEDGLEGNSVGRLGTHSRYDLSGEFTVTDQPPGTG